MGFKTSSIVAFCLAASIAGATPVRAAETGIKGEIPHHREYILSILTSSGHEDVADTLEIDDAKYAALGGLAVLGEADLLATFAKDSRQSALSRLIASCYLARLGRPDQADKLAAVAIDELSREHCRSISSNVKADSRYSFAAKPLFAFVAESFSGQRGAGALLKRLREMTLDWRATTEWRLAATLSYQMLAPDEFGALLGAVFDSYRESQHEWDIIDADERSAHASLAEYGLFLGYENRGSVEFILQYYIESDSEDRTKALKALARAALQADDIMLLERRFSSADAAPEEKALLAAILMRASATEQAADYLTYLEKTFLVSPPVVLGVLQYLPEHALAFASAAIESGDFETRSAAYSGVALWLSAGHGSIEAAQSVFDKACEEEHPVFLTRFVTARLAEEERPILSHYLISSKNLGLQQTGILSNLLFTPECNGADMAALANTAAAGSAPILASLALQSIPIAVSCEGAARTGAQLWRNESLFLASSAVRIIGTCGRPRAASSLSPFSYYFVVRDDPEGVAPAVSEDTRWLRRLSPHSPYRTTWQMYCWESAISQGLSDSVYDTTPPITLDPYRKVDDGYGGLLEEALGDTANFDDISEKQAMEMAHRWHDCGNAYERVCLALNVWLLEKDHRICARRLVQFVPFPLIYANADGTAGMMSVELDRHIATAGTGSMK